MAVDVRLGCALDHELRDAAQSYCRRAERVRAGTRERRRVQLDGRGFGDGGLVGRAERRRPLCRDERAELLRRAGGVGRVRWTDLAADNDGFAAGCDRWSCDACDVGAIPDVRGIEAMMSA